VVAVVDPHVRREDGLVLEVPVEYLPREGVDVRIGHGGGDTASWLNGFGLSGTRHGASSCPTGDGDLALRGPTSSNSLEGDWRGRLTRLARPVCAQLGTKRHSRPEDGACPAWPNNVPSADGGEEGPELREAIRRHAQCGLPNIRDPFLLDETGVPVCPAVRVCGVAEDEATDLRALRSAPAVHIPGDEVAGDGVGPFPQGPANGCASSSHDCAQLGTGASRRQPAPRGSVKVRNRPNALGVM